MALKASICHKVLRRLGVSSTLSQLGRGKLKVNGSRPRTQFLSLSSLINDHFSTYSDLNHPCRSTLTVALNSLGCSPAVIIETGSSAWGTNSTLLFDSYCNSFGGHCYSVDIRMDPLLQLRNIASRSTTLFCDDSVSFLRDVTIPDTGADLLYLDSWDVDWTDPIPSAVHGLNEYLTALKHLKPGALVLIDDTPADISQMQAVHPEYAVDFSSFHAQFGFAPGKGALVKQLVEATGRGTILAHEYQLLIRI